MKFSGSQLRSLREKAALTRDQLAEKSGVAKSTIKRLENDGDVNTLTSTINSLAAALEVDAINLYEPNGEVAA
jgi:transcriptional regulator with XRE-family HTH domain